MTRFVFAYLDPVTGSALLQMLLGAAAVVGLGYQYIRKAVNTVLARIRGTEAQPQPESSTADL
jgi:hypothetical protein